ncbi:hypothetical protein HCQ94_01790 [Actinomyces sp. zg-332]|uniref:lanthionine synthetase LanC family protein n=1 Tax=Actinomyces sp. zg-332 TaxID=2708340 RepID=UPI00141E8744|nr:lanthionine synthetase LanC family protein [Actinomyces sp. zg-332]QPK94465.1 hypothetical protein HCQ94_01790 [Actinomyces sp. zg-332]
MNIDLDFERLSELYLDQIKLRLQPNSDRYLFDISKMNPRAAISDLLSYPSGVGGYIYCLRLIASATGSLEAKSLADRLFELALVTYKQNRTDIRAIQELFALADLSISQYGKADSHLQTIILEWMDTISVALLDQLDREDLIHHGFVSTDLVSGICRGILLVEGYCAPHSLELLQELLKLETCESGKRVRASFSGAPSLVWAEKAVVASHRNYGIVHGLDGICTTLCSALSRYCTTDSYDAVTYERGLDTVDDYLEWRIDSAEMKIGQIPMTEVLLNDGSCIDCFADDGIWCYGGSGLLGACNARIGLDSGPFALTDKFVMLADRVFHDPVAKSLTLCHGESGRILSLRNFSDLIDCAFSQEELRLAFCQRLGKLLSRGDLSGYLDPDLLFSNDPLNIGVLSGLGGVVIAYFETLCERLPPSHFAESCLLAAPWLRPYRTLHV